MRVGDGTIVQNGVKWHQGNSMPNINKKIPYPVRAQVLQVYTIDDESNQYGETTVADVFVTSMNIKLYKVPVQLQRASRDNYLHTGTMQPASGSVDGTPFNNSAPDPQVSNGDSVIVQFIDASVMDPVITNMAPHKQSGFNGKSPSPRPTSDDGDCMKARWNGTNFWIDKDGNVLFENTPVYGETEPKNNKFTVNFEDGSGNNVQLVMDNSDEGNPTVTIGINGGGNAQSIALSNQGIEINVQGLVKIEAEGEVTVSGDKILLDGTAGGGPGAASQVLVFPQALSDFTGLPVQPASETVFASP